eukprot:6201377-Pleurochrysis_carterae.AAC.2
MTCSTMLRAIVATRSPQRAQQAIQRRNAASQTQQTEYSVLRRVNVGSQTVQPLPPPVTRIIDRPPPNMGVEPMEPVLLEVDAALSLHCRHHTRECCQEPITTLRRLAVSRVERYFQGWPSVKKKDGATVWRTHSPEELRKLLLVRKRHCLSSGCCKLHVKTGRHLGRALLMIQPKFVSWLYEACEVGPDESGHR